MSHIGILCPGAIGHLNPMCNLGAELLRRGHHVTLFSVPEIKEKVAQSGLVFSEIGASDFPLGTLAQRYAKLGELTGMAGVKYSIEFFDREMTMVFRDAPKAIDAENIDLLLIDQLTIPGGTIADLLKIPFITLCNALPINRDPISPPCITPWEYKEGRLARLRNEFGNRLLNYLSRSLWETVVQQRKAWQLSPYQSRNDSYSQLAQIAQLPQALDFPREQLPPWFHYAGPLKAPSEIEPISLNDQPFSFDALNDKPLIYANLGTMQSHNIAVFHCIAEACLDINAQLVISLGNPKADPLQTQFAGDPLVAAFPPHQQLINRARLVITHAGSTALSCLSSGKPMVAIPITTDQPGMAARIAYVGAGEVLPVAKLEVSKLKRAIQKVFEDSGYRENAERMRVAIQAAGGVSYAADVVERVVATGLPALNDRLE